MGYIPVNTVSFVPAKRSGKQNAVYNGHRYYFERIATGRKKSYWKCVLCYTGCKSRLVLDENNKVAKATEHNHNEHTVHKAKQIVTEK